MLNRSPFGQLGFARRQVGLLALPVLLLSATSAPALVIDFDALPEGTKVTNAVLPAGFTISTTNGNPAHPNQAIIFDSACVGGCTGDPDDDLKTPGVGTGNDVGQEKVMIIATNVNDVSPIDGLVDGPNDERRGGTIVLTFPEPRAVQSVRFIDIDGNETGGSVSLALNAGGTLTVAIPALGNNSGQTLVFNGSPIANSMTIFFKGSGAIDDITMSGGGGSTTTTLPQGPCVDSLLDFDSLPAGTIVSTVQTTGGQWVSVKGTNPKLGAAVNAAIIYDSACPGGCTGDDPDLGTPNEDFGGPGVGVGGSAGSPTQNDLALNKVLIIANGLKDGNFDNLVDDPNDQKNELVTQELDFGSFAPVSVPDMKFVDVGDTESSAKVELFDENGLAVVTVNVPPAENNGLVKLTLPPNSGIHKMIVTFHGSGAIDEIRFECEETTTTTTPTTTITVPTTTVTIPTTTVTVPTTTVTTTTSTTTTSTTVTTTTLPAGFCGDGILNPGEQCDNDGLNSDVVPDACRTNCTLPFCGDGVKDTHEFCEPSLTPGCTQDCHVPECPTQTEICNNEADDDGDTLIDCDDPDCLPSVPRPCGCGEVKKDPGYIRFDTKHGADFFSLHGNFSVYSSVTLDAEQFAVMLTNQHGIIWRGKLVPGELKRRSGGKGIYGFKDFRARGGGPGDSDNFSRVGLRIRQHDGGDHVHFRVRAYGDFKLATEATMSIQLLIGDDAAGTTQTWTRTNRGWILRLKDFEE